MNALGSSLNGHRLHLNGPARRLNWIGPCLNDRADADALCQLRIDLNRAPFERVQARSECVQGRPERERMWPRAFQCGLRAFWQGLTSSQLISSQLDYMQKCDDL